MLQAQEAWLIIPALLKVGEQQIIYIYTLLAIG
jgi:hypothetical protein